MSLMTSVLDPLSVCLFTLFTENMYDFILQVDWVMVELHSLPLLATKQENRRWISTMRLLNLTMA